MRKDILRDDDSTLQFANGDFATGQSDQQNVMAAIDFQPGEIKEFPLAGFGAINYMKTPVTASEFKRDLKLQLAYDGYTNANIDLSKGIQNLSIDI